MAGTGADELMGKNNVTGRNTKKRRNDRLGNQMAIVGITLVVFSLGVVVNVKSASMKKRDQEYQAREALLQQQYDQEVIRADELKEYQIYVQTKQYIEEVAKQKLGLVKPDEILLKPSDGNLRNLVIYYIEKSVL